EIVDVSNPAAPFLAGTTDSFQAQGVEVVGNQVFLATPAGVGELIVYDISNPVAPELTMQFRVPGAARSIRAANNFVYVGDDAATVDVFRLD
ncbi:MAG: hypothetical protein ACYTGV_20120, partial [Planctomycetota bacterium]